MAIQPSNLLEIFDKVVVTSHRLSSELLAEMIHPDPTGDMKEVRLAAADQLDALAELTAELQMLRN